MVWGMTILKAVLIVLKKNTCIDIKKNNDYMLNPVKDS